MPLIAQIGADASNFNKVMSGLGTTATEATSGISNSFNTVTASITKLEAELSVYKDKVATSFDPAAIGGYNNQIKNIESSLVTLRHQQEDLITPIKEMGNAAQTASSQVTQSLAQAANSTSLLGGQAMSATMRFQTMRSGMAAARDGVLAFSLGGQAAERSLLAMGHHMTSLVNETGSVKGAFGALLSSLWGAGGIILAISLAAELWSKYSESQKEAADAGKDYVSTLSTIRQAQLKGQQDGEQELVRVRLLYNATQDHTLSLKDRNKAYDELDKKYPKFFSNEEREKTLLGQNTAAYNLLSTAILQAAYAKAYEAQIGTNASRQYQDDQKILDLRIQQIKAAKTLESVKNQQSNAGASGFGGGANAAQLALVNKAQQDLNDIDKQIYNLSSDKNKLDIQNSELMKRASAAELAAGFKTDTQLDEKNKKIKEQATGYDLLQEKIKELKTSLQDLVATGGSPMAIKQMAIDLDLAEIKLSEIDKKIKNSRLASGGVPEIETGNTLRDSISNININKTPSTETDSGFEKSKNEFAALAKLKRESHAASNQYKSDTKEEAAALREVTNIIGGGLTNAFQTALAGTQSFAQAFGQFIIHLIERLIAAIAAAAILAALLSFTGLGAITGAATGIGAFASNFATGLGNIKLAEGGITNGPTHALIGEGREREAVMPLSKLQSFVNTGGGMKDGQIVGVLQGSNLLLQYQRASIQKGRVG